MYTSLLVIRVVMEPFKYPSTLIEKVKLLVQGVAKKNESLVYAQASLFMMEVAFDEANQRLNLTRKRIEELDTL